MRKHVPAILLLTVFAAGASLSAQSYYNINNSTTADQGIPGDTGWGSCSSSNCAGGTGVASIASSPFQSWPAIDGSSRDFYISGEGYSNALWWYKLGAHNSASHFTLDFWLYTAPSVAASAQALEFDVFQFSGGNNYTFGTQCTYESGLWALWNPQAGLWINTGLHCAKFQPNTWYHLTLQFHRGWSDNMVHYDTVSVQQQGRWWATYYNFYTAYPAGTLPASEDNMGVQFQMDIGATGANMEEWVDEVTLRTY
jgi:hypothetical protein